MSEIIPKEDRSAVLRRQIIGILSALPGSELPLLRALVHVRETEGAQAELGRLSARFEQENWDHNRGPYTDSLTPVSRTQAKDRYQIGGLGFTEQLAMYRATGRETSGRYQENDTER